MLTEIPAWSLECFMILGNMKMSQANVLLYCASGRQTVRFLVSHNSTSLIGQHLLLILAPLVVGYIEARKLYTRPHNPSVTA